MKKMFGFIDLSRWTNWNFSETTGMIFRTKVAIENFQLTEDDWINIIFVFIYASDLWQSNYYNKVLFILIALDDWSFNSQLLKVRLPPSKNKSETQCCRQIFNCKFIVFLPCIRILVVWKLQRNISIRIFLDIQTQFLTKLQAFLLQSRSDR